MTPRLGFIHPNDRVVPCCECPTIATHIGWDDAPSFLCDTHLVPWMQWRGLTFDYEAVRQPSGNSGEFAGRRQPIGISDQLDGAA